MKSANSGMVEADITINGETLTFSQAMTLRVALSSFRLWLADEGTPAQLGESLTAGYQARASEVEALMFRNLGSPTVLGDIERAMASKLWCQLLAIWKPNGHPTTADDSEILEDIAGLGNGVGYLQAMSETERKAALWDRLVSAWNNDDGPLDDNGVSASLHHDIDQLVGEWERWLRAQPPVIVPSWQVAPYIVTPIELADPVDPPEGPTTETRTVAHEAFYDNDVPAPTVPGEFSNVFFCIACEGNVAAGKTCHRCGRKGPLGQGIDWAAGIGRMAEIKTTTEAMVASAPAEPPGAVSVAEMRSMLAQAAHVVDLLAKVHELAGDLRSDLQINLNRMPKP
jgi:hypothetical protein